MSTVSSSNSIVSSVNSVATDINQFLPLATQAVLQVEATKAGSSSTNKLATALGYVMDAATVGEQVPVPAVSAISSLVAMIDDIVAGFNSAGLFSHSAATGSSASQPASPSAATTLPISTLPTPTSPIVVPSSLPTPVVTPSVTPSATPVAQHSAAEAAATAAVKHIRSGALFADRMHAFFHPTAAAEALAAEKSKS